MYIVLENRKLHNELIGFKKAKTNINYSIISI